MKHISIRLAVINACPVLVPSKILLSTHLPTTEGWTAELTVGLWLVVPTTGFEPTRVDLTRFETLRLNHSATPISFTRSFSKNEKKPFSKTNGIRLSHRPMTEAAVLVK